MGLSANRNTPVLGAGGVPVKTDYPLAANAIIYDGALVAINTAGYLVPASADSTLKCVGTAFPVHGLPIDNTGGSAGDKTCPVVQGVARYTNSNSMTLASVGGLVYAVDDSAVSSSSAGSTRPVAGTLYLVDANGAWVYIGLAAPLDATSLTTFISNLAAATIGEGASLVGFYDPSSLFAAATVEGALTEAIQNALNKPIGAYCALANMITGAFAYRFVAPYTGKLLRVDACGAVTVSTSGKTMVLAATISGSAVTGLTLTLTSAALTTVGNRVAGVSATAANTFAAGQEIEILVSGNPTAFAEGAVNLEIFLSPL